jgi:hypothetical protein
MSVVAASPTFPSSKLLWTKAQAAEALSVSIDWLEDHVLPEIRVIKHGRKVLIPVRELETWIDQNLSRYFISS